MNQEKTQSKTSEFREQQERELMTSLKSKVESVKKLKEILDDLDLDMDIGEVVMKLHDHFDEVKKQYPGIVQKLAYLGNLEQEASAISAKIDEMIHHHGEGKIDNFLTCYVLNGIQSIKPEERAVAEQAHVLYMKAEEVRNKIDDLQGDDSLAFINSLQNGIDNAIRRFLEIKKLKKSKEELTERIVKILKIPNEGKEKIWENILDIEYNPIAINITVTNDFFNTHISTSSIGVHYLNTPINFIRDTGDDEDMAETITHEETHSFTDGFLRGYAGREKYKAEFWVNSLKTQIETLDSIIEQDALNEDPKIKSTRDFTLDIPYFGNLRNFIDSLHEEIIADFERVQDAGNFSNPEKLKSAVVFTTAHNDALTSIQGLNDLKKIAKSPLMKKKLEEMFVTIGEYMNRIVYQMNKAYFIARELNSEKELEALLAVLKPSQYHHLKRYLIDKHGKDAYDKAEQKVRDAYNKVEQKVKNAFQGENDEMKKDENEKKEAA